MRILIERGGEIVDPDDAGVVAATVADGNPLANGWDAAGAIAHAAADRPLVLWSGACADDLFAAHPHTWGAPGWDALARACDALAPRLAERGCVACFRPHARHVLSDAPSCRRFLTEHADGPFGLALAPALMLEPSMVRAIEDHLERIFESVAADARFLFLADIVTDGERCRAVPLGQGVMPREHVLGLIGRHLPPYVPVVLADADVGGQRAWLGRGNQK